MINPAGENKIAIVIPWFGRTLKGGAELQAWNLATRLNARGYSIEVLTTCCQSFQDDWSANHHPAGLSQEPEGFAVRRFPVESRDRAAFDRVCGHLLSLDPKTLKPGVSPISEEDERIFCEHLIRCPSLLEYLAQEGWRYASFLFLPYLYGPILDGLPLVASRSLLQPCLHDEAYAYLRCVQQVVFSAQRLLWLSQGEFELGYRLFGPSVLSKSVVGMAGIEPRATDETVPPAVPVRLAALQSFALLLGRKDPGKGTLLAVDAFRAHQAARSTPLNLVIAGPGPLALADPLHRIHDLGLVSEDERHWLLQNAKILVQPSPNESFSRVMFEAWQYGTPVIVRRSCLATATAVQAAGGGWSAETKEEWTALFARLETAPEQELAAMGERGAAYTAQTAAWERVMERYDEVLHHFINRAETPFRLRCVLGSDQAQQIRLLVGDRAIAVWQVDSGMKVDSGWLVVPAAGMEPLLRFECDQPKGGPAPNFRLETLELEMEGRSGILPLFSRGWKRSECLNGSTTPRWSTGGSAEIRIAAQVAAGSTQSIHQVLPNLGYGDAIGNHTLWIRDRLQALGYHSEIYARHIVPAMIHQAYHYSDPDRLPADAAIIYHHSIGSEITPWVCRHPGPKAMIYHNITPAKFFVPFRPEFAEILRHGRDELPSLAPYFPVSVGDSRFNADELRACGFTDPAVLPLCIDPAHWSSPPDEQVMQDLQDGRTNILFVGRIVPNKRHEDLIYTFKFWLEDDPEARLFLVGTAEVSSFYLECLQELACRLRVDHAVHFVGQVTDAQLHAYYRCASMFWCFSEHEGFCVPLIEACAFGVPVVARTEGAVAETLADAGLLLYTRPEPGKTASWIASNRAVDRAKMQARLEEYSAANVTRRLQDLIDKLLAHPPIVHP